MTESAPIVLIAGATGYLGQHLVKAYSRSGYRVRALARRRDGLSPIAAFVDETFIGEVTRPETLDACCNGVDLVVSAIGITRQRDGLTYDQVDYQANANLLNIALAANVKRFAYVHVLNAEQMPQVAMARAKARFAETLKTSPIASTILCPSGFFSDLSEILTMAQQKRVYLFGNGETKISPIDGADLARVCVEATEAGIPVANIGGPETFTQNEIAKLAFEVLEQPARITHIPLCAGRFFVRLLNLFRFKAIAGPLEFFLAASALDMSAPPHGHTTLKQAFRAHLAFTPRPKKEMLE